MRHGAYVGIQPQTRPRSDVRPDPLPGSYHISAIMDDGTLIDFVHEAPVALRLDDICARFGRGTLIATPRGEVAVEDLRPGDRLRTRDNGDQPLRWIGSCNLDHGRIDNPALMQGDAPDDDMPAIRIKADALGELRPMQDLVVSRRFRMLTNHAACAALFGTPETLAPAAELLDEISIARLRPSADMEFYNLMCDRHQIILANGLETETWHPGPYGVATMEADQHDALRHILPHLAGDLSDFGPLARPLLRGFEAEVLRAV